MKRLNNKGLSLVELVIAIAMSTIVVGAAAVFLYNAEKSYRVAEYSVDLQTEAQILMEQMSNWVLMSNWVQVIDESTDQSILVLYYIPNNEKKYKLEEEGGTLKLKATTGDAKATRSLIFVQDKKLYYISDTESVTGEYLNEIKAGGFDKDSLPTPSDEDCVGEFVSGFTVDIPFGVDADKINSIIVKLGMSEGVNTQSQSYSVKNQFSIRNSIYEVVTEEAADPDGGI